MNKKTQNLIQRLRDAQSLDHMIELTTNDQLKLKNKLIKENVVFHEEDSQFHQGIIGGQKISGLQNLGNANAYQEINYIREGLIYEWATMVDEVERFDPIRKQVKEIQETFE